MQVYKYKRLDMKRDMELVRNLLLGIERDPQLDGTQWVEVGRPSDLGITNHSLEEVAYHVRMLVEGGFVKGNVAGEMPVISKLTWQGHEFLDDIRDQDIWDKTKERAKGLASVGLTLIWEIARPKSR